MRTFIVFELFVLGLFLLACWQVLQRGISYRTEFVIALLYALLFEELDIRFFKTYQYGPGYTLLLGHVPLVIPLAWAVILSTSMQMSDSCALSDAARACCDALLAVLLDLSVDAIAIRRGYWQWNIPLQAGWFGVPAGNLYAWMFAVFFFSLLCRHVRWLSATHRPWLALELLVPPVAYLGLVLSLLAVGTLNALLRLDEQAKLGSVLAVGALFLVGLLHRRWRSGLQGPGAALPARRGDTPGPAWVLPARIAGQWAVSDHTAACGGGAQRAADRTGHPPGPPPMTLPAVLKEWSAEETPMLAPHVRKRDTPLGRWGPVVLYTVNWALWLLTGLWAGAWERLWLAALPLLALGLYLWRTRRLWR